MQWMRAATAVSSFISVNLAKNLISQPVILVISVTLWIVRQKCRADDVLWRTKIEKLLGQVPWNITVETIYSRRRSVDPMWPWPLANGHACHTCARSRLIVLVCCNCSEEEQAVVFYLLNVYDGSCRHLFSLMSIFVLVAFCAKTQFIYDAYDTRRCVRITRIPTSNTEFPSAI